MIIRQFFKSMQMKFKKYKSNLTVTNLFCGISLLSLVGCSYFSPDYTKPTIKIPNHWNSQTTGIESISESLPYLAWWQKFNDPTLNYYIESGLLNNINLQQAKANLEAANGQLLSAKLNWIPFVSLFGGEISGSSQNSFTPIGNLGTIASNGGFFAILPAYTVNLFTNYTAQKQAGYNVEAAKNAELSVRLAVIGQVASAYFAILAQEQTLQQYLKLNSTITNVIEITTSMKNRGLTNELSINELNSRQQLIAGQISLAEHNLQLAKNALQILINEAPNNMATKNSFTKINPNQIIPGNMPVSVIASRPDILRAEDKLKAANEGISVTSSALLPSVNLNYFYANGSGSQTFNTPIPNTEINNSNKQSYYAAYANWTISPSLFGQINTSHALFNAELANYKYVVNSALHEVDNALSANNGWNKKMLADRNALTQLENTIKTKQAMHKRGLIPYTMVLLSIAEQQLLDIDITQTKLQQMISLVSIYQSLGGGYQYQNESQIISKATQK